MPADEDQESIATLYALVLVDEHGDETLATIAYPGSLVEFHLAGTDVNASVQRLARELARKKRQTVRIVQFGRTAVVEEIKP